MDLDKYLPFADQPTRRPQEGTWVLIAPDGSRFNGASPLHCVRAESKTRIPPEVALGRIARSLGSKTDAERLDWLDAKNKPFRMGWNIGCAPAGNVSVRGIITGGTTIREAIDKTMEAHPIEDSEPNSEAAVQKP